MPPTTPDGQGSVALLHHSRRRANPATKPGRGDDSWQHGGGSVWVTGSFDPALNLTYWGIGNPGPDWNGVAA